MEEDARPLSAEERAELEALRAEKAAREERARAARERAELEALRAEQQRSATGTHDVRKEAPRRSTAAPAQATTTLEEDRRIAEARARGAELMQPDDDLRMPVGQKIVLAVIALLVALIVGMHFLVG